MLPGKITRLPAVAGPISLGLVLIFGCTSRQEILPPDSAEKPEPTVSSPRSEAAAPAGEYTKAGPVSVRLRSPAVVSRGETTELVVEFRVAPQWEIHAVDSHPDEAATRLNVELPQGIEASGEWEFPPGQASLAPGGKWVYAGSFAARLPLRVTESAASGEQQVVCRVRFQACDERQCLRPEEVELEGTLVIE
jgi:hypothetical protein